MLSCQGSQLPVSDYDAYIDRAAEVWRFQGSYLVAKGDSIVACGSRGIADLADHRPNTPGTRFLIGSITKSFTAIAILRLAEQGLLAIDQNIAAYIDSYPTDKDIKITVYDLLCHRSGIPDVSNNREFMRRMGDSISAQEIVSYFRDEPLTFEPGSQYSYSSSNYVLLGLIIEAVTGSTWEEYIHNNICEPTAMTNTDVFYDYSTRAGFARGYALDSSGSLTAAPFVNPSIGYAAGALASNVIDLFRLNMALYDTTLLTKASIEMMLTAHSPKYGFGWLVDDFGGHRLTAHGGGAPGYSSIIQRWPDDSVCVVVLCNAVNRSVHTIANGLAAIALGESYEMPYIKKSVSMTHAQLAEYEGNYCLGPDECRQIQLLNETLVVQRPFGSTIPLHPEGKDRFYFAHDPMTTMTFLRDSDGRIFAQVVSQGFDHDTAQRVE